LNAKTYLYTLAVAAMGFLAAPVNASTLNSITVDGAVYSASYTTVTTNDYRFTLNIDLSNYTGGGSYLNSLAFKVGGQAPTFALISAPDATSNWTSQSGNLNANGCGGGSSGSVCITDTANPYGLNINSYKGTSNPLTFVFDMGNNAITSNGLQLMALYEKSNGNKAGSLVSKDLTLPTTTTTVSTVPLPAAAWLFGSALLGFTMVSSRKKV
jgi:hypothetical protein